MAIIKKSASLLVLIALAFPGVVFALTPPIESTARLPLIRLYNPTINDHFYTTSRAEASMAQSSHGYRIEGEMGWVYQYQQSGTEPLFRLWNPRASKHFYTSSYIEAQNAENNGFVREGNMGFIVASASGYADILLHRMYNPSQQKHFYTTDKKEVEYLETRGYVWEGQVGGGLYVNEDGSQLKNIFSATSDNIFVGGTYWVYPRNGKMVFEYFGPSSTNVSYEVHGVPNGMTVEGGTSGMKSVYRGDIFSINVNSNNASLTGTLFVVLSDTYGNSSTIQFEINGAVSTQAR